MRDKIEAYLRAHETAWASSTLKSERSRLGAVAYVIDDGPEATYQYLVGINQKPYTIKTAFVRLVDLEKWIGRSEAFQTYMRDHARRFRHFYEKEEVQVSYEEAQKRIGELQEPYRSMARGLLQTGCRISEAYDIRDGRVVGKGGKTRKIYGKIEETAPKSTFWRKLKAVGLKPHTLRKLCATRLAELGASPADLCKVFGWRSIGTAYQYLQAKDDERLQALMEKGTKGI